VIGTYKILFQIPEVNGFQFSEKQPGYREGSRDCQLRRRWSKVVAVCESLAAQGLNYTVHYALNVPEPHVLIFADGTPKAAAVRRPVRSMVQPVKAAVAKAHKLEAAWFLPEWQDKKKSDGAAYWRRHAARRSELERMAQDEIRAEFEFWQELESLSETREHFKPGLAVDAVKQDDEVRIAA
jgi:hypothetical protein